MRTPYHDWGPLSDEGHTTKVGVECENDRVVAVKNVKKFDPSTDCILFAGKMGPKIRFSLLQVP